MTRRDGAAPIRDGVAIGLLAFGQTIAWAGIYYIFAALLLTWERETGWSKPELTLALTLAILTSSMAAPVAGRLVDRGRGALMIGCATALGGLAVACLSLAQNLPAFYSLWILIGACQAGALYEACFAIVTRARGPAARRAITTIALVAGFASAIAFSGTAFFLQRMEWREVAVIFGLGTLILAAPASWQGARQLERSGAMLETRVPERSRAAHPAPRALLLLLALAFPMMALNHGMILNHLLPLLDSREIAPDLAVLAASIIGPMQVAGRLVMMLAERRISSLTATLVSFAGVILAALMLLASQIAPVLIFVSVILQGATYGLISILKPVVIAEFSGPAGIARVLGWMALPYLGCFALAPYLGALIWTVGGYDLMLIAAAGFAAAGFAAIAFAARFRPDQAA
ncbi:MAG: MFS transporter [Pseudomonadota bacterium]